MIKNLISVDLEDWYTSAYLRDFVHEKNPRSQIEKSTMLVLDLFERYNIKATFFCLGLIAEKHPSLIEAIHQKGHEIASHGYSHQPLWNLNPKSFREEIQKTTKVLKKITQRKPKGYRAPYFSISKNTAWALDIIEEEGFLYDSSIFPVKTPLYGAPGAPLSPYFPSKTNIYENDNSRKIREYPLTIFKLGSLKIPISGGFYLRFFPFSLIKLMIQNINKKGRPFILFFHPWEVYPKIPHVNVPIKNRFITYYGTKSCLKKIELLLKKFKFICFRDESEFS